MLNHEFYCTVYDLTTGKVLFTAFNPFYLLKMLKNTVFHGPFYLKEYESGKTYYIHSESDFEHLRGILEKKGEL